MFDDDEKDEDISIDFGKIKNFFKKKEELKEEKKKEELEEKPKREEETKKEAEEIRKKEIDKQTEEDEISFDVSKIKHFFKKKDKGKREEKELEEAKEESKDEDEISFDFGRIKSFFKKKGKGREEKEELDFDASTVTDFFKRYGALLLLLIPLFLSIHLRLYTAYLPITDDWAENAVYNQIRSQIREQINQQYPNLPTENKNLKIEKKMQEFVSEQKEQINQQIKATSDYFKSKLQNENGQTYLLEMDPYFWMRDAQNLLEKGHVGDEIRNGVPWDNHMLAPLGRATDVKLHPYLEAYLYKAVHFFNRDVDLMTVAFYIPVILSALAVIPAFFIGRRISGNFGGLIAGIVVAIHPAFLTRTIGGFSDTDAYNILFPLLITWLYLEAFETKERIKKVSLAAISGFLVGVFAFTWIGWWYIFDFIAIASLLYLIYYVLLHREELKKGIKNFIMQSDIKNTLALLAIFVVVSGIFVTLFAGVTTFKDVLTEFSSFVKLKEVGITTIWPNVYTTVAEQNSASLNTVISQIGTGWILVVLISLIGIALTMVGKDSRRISDLLFLAFSTVWFGVILFIKPQNLMFFLVWISIPIIIKFIIALIEKDFKIDIKIAILIFMWYASTIYASTKGLRFTLLLVPAFAIAFGIALGIAYKYIMKWLPKELGIAKWIPGILMCFVFLLVLGFVLLPIYPLCMRGFGDIRFMCYQAKEQAKNEIPSVNDAWYVSLDKIRVESEPNAIINSWWDFGHWFKNIADRAVTFDGTSQNTPMAHWVGKALLTDNEHVAIGILRMLDCGSARGFDYLYYLMLKQEYPNLVEDDFENFSASNLRKKIMSKEGLTIGMAETQINSIFVDTKYLLDDLILLDREGAREALIEKGLDKEEIEILLEYTHCDPPEDYFIVSEDMVGKSGVWSHFGDWNFDKALIYNTLKKKEYMDSLDLSATFLKERLNYSREDSEDIYYEIEDMTNDEANSWISPLHSYGGVVQCSQTSNSTLECSFIQNLILKIDLDNMQADIPIPDGRVLHPNSLVYATEEGFNKKEFNDTIGVGATLYPAGGGRYNIIVASPRLGASVFTRLFYLEGHGLEHFEKFSDQMSVFGGRIIVWKVNWEGGEKNILDDFKEPAAEEGMAAEFEEGTNLTSSNITSNITNESQ